jgi:hypothetical protein
MKGQACYRHSDRALFAWFRALWPDIERGLFADDRIVEVS